jgi:hypothetical protein
MCFSEEWRLRMLKRLRVALDLSRRFISRPITLTFASAPIVFWPLKRLFVDHTSWRQDVILLAILYAVGCATVFAWKFGEAATVMEKEPAVYAQINGLDVQEQGELKRLIRAGKLAIGPPILDRIAAKTDFIYRDVSGEWRVEQEHRRFLTDWEKQSDS